MELSWKLRVSPGRKDLNKLERKIRTQIRPKDFGEGNGMVRIQIIRY